MKQWDDSLFLEGEENIRTHFGDNTKTLLIMGKGFDPRACRMLEILKDSTNEMTVCMVDYNDRTIQKNENNESRSEENYNSIKEMCLDKDLLELSVPQYVGENEKGVLVISESVKNVFDYGLIKEYERIMIDISAMPRSVGFSIIKRILDIQKEQKVCILVCENSRCDDRITPIIAEESAQYLPGFNTFSMSLESDDDDTVWFPVLGMNEVKAFSIIADYLKAVEICPVVPFPAIDIRRSENILRCYGKALFKDRGVDRRNIIYVPEKQPQLIYRKLYDTVCYYEKALNIDEDRSIKFAFSSQSSKLIDIGILLTMLALLKNGKKAGIVVVKNRGYNLKTEYNKQDENVYCLCLNESEFDW